jgi:septal ring factor EnvC (AmiA/AmiB activator)
MQLGLSDGLIYVALLERNNITFVKGHAMDGTTPASPFDNYTSPWRNLAWSLRKSRDNWKHKHQLLQRDHKRLQNQLRDVRASRSHWRQAAEEAQHTIHDLEQKLAQLQAELAASQAASEKRG